MRKLVADELFRVEGAEDGEEQIVFHTTPKADAILERIDTARREGLNQILADRAPHSTQN